MLNNLSSAFKKGFDKIAGSIFLDRKTIDAVVKDLQRALIQADVNIHLVKEIGDRLKKEAENEKIKGIERKEHLTKVLHDELLNLLGGEKHELKLEKNKKTKIMLVGLYGAGKCVHGDSKIVLGDGDIISAERLYGIYSKKLSEKELEDGRIISLEKENLFVPSFNPNTLEIENKKITHLWKLKKNDLIDIKIDSGNDYSIKVTPEHPFFVLRNGQVIKIKAEDVSQEDYIAIPKEYSLNGVTQNLFNKLRELDLFVHLSHEEVKNNLQKNNLLLRDICSGLKFKTNYCSFTHKLKKGIIPIDLIEDEMLNYLNLRKRGSRKVIKMPLYLTEEFAEFLGYIIGDGHIEQGYAEITSENSEIISRISDLARILFNIKPSIKREKRSKNLYKIILVSSTLVEILKIFGLNPGRKGRKLSIPQQVIKSNNNIVTSFIRAYFDCDSYPAQNRRSIEIVSESKILIQQLGMLLRRFSINSTISKKEVNEIGYWRLVIKSRSAETYAEKIGYLIKSKQKKISNYKNIGAIQGCGKEDMIPIGKFLKELRLTLGFSIGEIQKKAVNSYGIYEKKGLISREMLLKLFYFYKNNNQGLFYKFFEDIQNKTYKEKYSNEILNGITFMLEREELIQKDKEEINLNQKSLQLLKEYQKFDPKKSIEQLGFLANSNVYWSRVQQKEKISNDKEYVYDLTVKDNHSFIAEGFIVHNTTTTSKLAVYYSKRGFKTAMLGLDVHRPAAADQLEQLGEQNKIAVFTDKGEKDPIKIYEKYEDELKDYDLVVIDTAGRHDLDKELVNEIKDVIDKIKPDYKLLTIQADIGQAARTQASEFQKTCDINGIIITRMDSTAKAGGALTACNETKAPVYFLGVGEKANEFETFNPKSFISRMLGLGDLDGLLEKVQSAIDEKSQKKLKKRLDEGNFNLRDFQEQLKSMSGMGSLSKMLEMFPGVKKDKIPEDMLGVQESKVKKWQHAIDSMTEVEINNPEIIEKETKRISRIAKGSGNTTTDIRQLLKQYKLLRELSDGSELTDFDPSQGLSQKQMMKIAKKFGKKIKF